MDIRRVRPIDRSEWLRMREALWPGRRDEHARDIDDFFDHHHNHMVVLVTERSDGNLGGFVEVNIRDYAEGCKTRNVGYIEGWYVDPDMRRQAIGRALVGAAENWARELGCCEMASDCELENDVSLRAHRALGYTETQRLIHFRKSLGQGT